MRKKLKNPVKKAEANDNLTKSAKSKVHPIYKDVAERVWKEMNNEYIFF